VIHTDLCFCVLLARVFKRPTPMRSFGTSTGYGLRPVHSSFTFTPGAYMLHVYRP